MIRGTQSDFSMIYKLPDGLVGEQILFRYRYVTANSCLPPGYEAYFTKVRNGEVLPSSYWKGELTQKTCSYPLPDDGSRNEFWPEQFYNWYVPNNIQTILGPNLTDSSF